MKRRDGSAAAFVAMALHACGFLVSYELMRTRPDSAPGIPAAALAHLVGLAMALWFAPSLYKLGGAGRGAVCAVFLATIATRLPGVGGWLESAGIRYVIQFGQGALAAAAYWLFFSLTPRDKWVWRYISTWLIGIAGKTIIVATAGLSGGGVQSILYLSAAVVFALLAVAVAACVWLGDFSPPVQRSRFPQTGTERMAKRAFAILVANTFLVAMFIGILSGWVGAFRSLWTEGGAVAQIVTPPVALLMLGWVLSKNFNAGFRRMAALCAALCFAIATLAVLRSRTVPTESVAVLAVGCQTIFYALMTLALVRVASTPRRFALATVTSYLALFASGLAVHWRMPLQTLDFSVVVALCIAVFMEFYFYTNRVDFAAYSAPAPVQTDAPDKMIATPSNQSAVTALSPREQEVAVLILSGMTTPDIARNLHISRYTVYSHIANMCEKTGVDSREKLAGILARRSKEI